MAATLFFFISVLFNCLACPGAIVVGNGLQWNKPKPEVNKTKPQVKRWRQKMKNIGDLQYYGTATLGTQELSTVMDTGSIELVVISDLCKTWCGSLEHLYHAERKKERKATTTLSYGSGDLVAQTQTGPFQIGPFKAEQQRFWQVQDANMPLLANSKFAVILGLGPQDPNRFANQGRLAHSLGIKTFGVCLISEPHQPGFITWNDVAHQRTPQLFTQIPIHDSGFWLAELKNVKLGNTALGCAKGCGAIIDSGTSLLAMPNNAYQKMQNLIWKLGPDCDHIEKMPSLHFELGGKTLTLPPDAYLGILEGSLVASLHSQFDHTKTGCQQAFMHVAMDSSLGETWILGMPFLRSYYTIFSQGAHPEVFVSRANKDCRPSNGNLGMEMFNQTRTASKARRIDMAQIYMPLWLQKAQAAKRLDERNTSTAKK